MCADLIRGAKEKNLKVKGPVRMPTKVLKYILDILARMCLQSVNQDSTGNNVASLNGRF